MKNTYEILLSNGVQPSLLKDSDTNSFELFCRQAENGSAEFEAFAVKCREYMDKTDAQFAKAVGKAIAILKSATDLLESVCSTVSDSLFSAFSSDSGELWEKHCKTAVALQAKASELSALPPLFHPNNSETHHLSTELLLRKIAISEYSASGEHLNRFNHLSVELKDFENEQEARFSKAAELIQTAVKKMSELAAETERAAKSGSKQRFDSAVRGQMTLLHDISQVFTEI